MLWCMPFEVFDKATATAGDKPTVSIQRRGVLSFNHATHKLLGEPQTVELLYDRKRRLVGLRAISSDVRHAQKVRLNDKGTTHLVTAMSFTAHYGIPTDVGHRWEAHQEGDVVFIDLNEEPLT
jgi:hypothetical protein